MSFAAELTRNHAAECLGDDGSWMRLGKVQMQQPTSLFLEWGLLDVLMLIKVRLGIRLAPSCTTHVIIEAHHCPTLRNVCLQGRPFIAEIIRIYPRTSWLEGLGCGLTRFCKS